MKMKLSKRQENLIRQIVHWHRAGKAALIEGGAGGLYSRHTIESLLKRGLIRYANSEWLKRGWRNPADGRFHYSTYEVEMTAAGWDHIYRTRPTIK
jgi:hypothetical protein